MPAAVADADAPGGGHELSPSREALEALYDRVSPGGFVIIDDCWMKPCRKAMHDFRTSRAIRAEILDIDQRGAYWRRA